jgi:hypothetical protein
MAKQARSGKPSGNSDGAGQRKASPAAAKPAAAKPATGGKAKPAPTSLETGSAGWIGSIGAALLGVVLLGFGGYALFERGPTLRPLSIALILTGAAQIILGWRSIAVRSRGAWSFLMSINGTLFVVFLFGSPKLRDEFHTPLGVALIPCVLFAIVTVMLSLSAREYERRH